MTMVPMWKRCSKCHKKYDWNPDVGNFSCPYCHGLGLPKKGIFEGLSDKIKNRGKDDTSDTAENPTDDK